MKNFRRFLKELSRIMYLLGMSGLFISLSACVTATPAGPPPLTKREGEAPKAAFLPWNTNDQVVAQHAYEQLKSCLEERNIFQFVPRQQVLEVIEKGNYDMSKVFGLSENEYQEIAKTLHVEYTLSGTVSVIKDLTLAGWRKDISSELRINKALDGSKVDSWLSNTSMTFTDTKTALDANKMADSAMNNLCSRIIQSQF